MVSATVSNKFHRKLDYFSLIFSDVKAHKTSTYEILGTTTTTDNEFSSKNNTIEPTITTNQTNITKINDKNMNSTTIPSVFKGKTTSQQTAILTSAFRMSHIDMDLTTKNTMSAIIHNDMIKEGPRKSTKLEPTTTINSNAQPMTLISSKLLAYSSKPTVTSRAITHSSNSKASTGIKPAFSQGKPSGKLINS